MSETIYVPCIGEQPLRHYDKQDDQDKLNRLKLEINVSLHAAAIISSVDCTRKQKSSLKILVGDSLGKSRFICHGLEIKNNFRGLLIVYGINQLCWVANIATKMGFYLQKCMDNNEPTKERRDNFFLGRLRVCEPTKEQLSRQAKDELDQIVEGIFTAVIELYKDNNNLFSVGAADPYICTPFDTDPVRAKGINVERHILGVNTSEHLAEEVLKMLNAMNSTEANSKLVRFAQEDSQVNRVVDEM